MSVVIEFQFTCPSRSTTSILLQILKFYTEFQFTCPSRSTTLSATPEPIFHEFQFTCPSRSTTSLINSLI